MVWTWEFILNIIGTYTSADKLMTDNRCLFLFPFRDLVLKRKLKCTIFSTIVCSIWPYFCSTILSEYRFFMQNYLTKHFFIELAIVDREGSKIKNLIFKVNFRSHKSAQKEIGYFRKTFLSKYRPHFYWLPYKSIQVQPRIILRK